MREGQDPPANQPYGNVDRAMAFLVQIGNGWRTQWSLCRKMLMTS